MQQKQFWKFIALSENHINQLFANISGDIWMRRIGGLYWLMRGLGQNSPHGMLMYQLMKNMQDVPNGTKRKAYGWS